MNPEHVGYVAAGYVVTAVALAAYALRLGWRLRRARQRAGDVAARRAGTPR